MANPDAVLAKARHSAEKMTLLERTDILMLSAPPGIEALGSSIAGLAAAPLWRLPPLGGRVAWVGAVAAA
jgi:hypothetical protein